MIDTLKAADRKIVEKILTREGGLLTRDAFYRARKKEWTTTKDRFNGRYLYDDLLANTQSNLKCNPVEAEALANGSMFSWNLLERGIARRITKNAPAELAAALSLTSRLHWVTICAPGRMIIDKDDDAWWILFALAAGDIDCARAYFGTKPRRLPNGNEPSVVLYNTLMAILTIDNCAVTEPM